MFKNIRHFILILILSITFMTSGIMVDDGFATFGDGWREQLSWVKKTAAYTAKPGDNLLVDTTAATVTITLPAVAKFGDHIRIVDSDATFDTNNCTVARNGHNIRSAAANITMAVESQYISLVYVDATVGWSYTTMSNASFLATVINLSENTVLTAAQCVNSTIYLTGNITVTLPAVAIGLDTTIYSTDATVKHLDTNASDRLRLSGVALDDGDKATSPGAAGDAIHVQGDSAAGWTELGMVGGWVDGGA